MIDEPPQDNPVPQGGRTAPSLVVVNTGDGKGKSSAAFGVMVRALAIEWKVAVVQFIKSGDWNVGEEKLGRQLGVDWHNVGEGFTWDSENLEHDIAIAREGWETAASIIASGDHRLVVLDELTYLCQWGWLDPAEVVAAIEARPANVNLVITGRDAPQEFIDVADTVTEMVKVKHAFDGGILAKRGIDY